MTARDTEVCLQRQDGAGHGQHECAGDGVRGNLAERDGGVAHGPHQRELQTLRGPFARDGACRGGQQGDDQGGEDSTKLEVYRQLAEALRCSVAPGQAGERHHPRDGRYSEHRKRPRSDERLQFKHEYRFHVGIPLPSPNRPKPQPRPRSTRRSYPT